MAEPGQTFGRYLIEARLGRGGMGEVFRARDTLLKRSVALKVLIRDEASGTDGNARLLREAQAAAALDHPHAVHVHDVGEQDGVTFIAMELVEGESLRERLKRPVEQRELMRWLGEVAEALTAAHALGLVHRDIKPDNVMIRTDGHAKVLDFGVARRAASASPPADDHLAPLTAEGVVVGTPAYMAPEQLAAGAIDPRADQFAWGVMAFEALSGGRLPWGRPKAVFALGMAMFTTPPERLTGVPEPLADLVARTLGRHPHERFASMDEVVTLLACIARGETVPTGALAAPRADAPRAKEEMPVTRVDSANEALASTAAAPSVGSEAPAILSRSADSVASAEQPLRPLVASHPGGPTLASAPFVEPDHTTTRGLTRTERQAAPARRSRAPRAVGAGVLGLAALAAVLLLALVDPWGWRAASPTGKPPPVAVAPAAIVGSWQVDSTEVGGRGAGEHARLSVEAQGSNLVWREKERGGATYRCVLAGARCSGTWTDRSESGWFEVEFSSAAAFTGTWGYGNDRARTGMLHGYR